MPLVRLDPPSASAKLDRHQTSPGLAAMPSMLAAVGRSTFQAVPRLSCGNLMTRVRLLLVCQRCGAQMEPVRSIPQIRADMPEVFLFQCKDCGHVVTIEEPDLPATEA
jgi:DNA-directed RNA polymerase subunit M/transcription elongation factor TFIIS